MTMLAVTTRRSSNITLPVTAHGGARGRAPAALRGPLLYRPRSCDRVPHLCRRVSESALSPPHGESAGGASISSANSSPVTSPSGIAARSSAGSGHGRLRRRGAPRGLVRRRRAPAPDRAAPPAAARAARPLDARPELAGLGAGGVRAGPQLRARDRPAGVVLPQPRALHGGAGAR